MALVRGSVELRSAVEWRSWLWANPVKWALGDLSKFRDKRIMEIGCNTGAMARFFCALGASVHGFDINEQYIDEARSYRSNARFEVYSGDVTELPSGYDFIFTKSVLVVIPDCRRTLEAIASKLRPGGAYLAVENLQGSSLMRRLRKWPNRGLSDSDIDLFDSVFSTVITRRYFNLIVAIRALHK
jgi:2-polyprenyl-3-methyl-5-hydroxy-6-metoxy-1,4-benzoquinol methylase